MQIVRCRTPRKLAYWYRSFSHVELICRSVRWSNNGLKRPSCTKLSRVLAKGEDFYVVEKHIYDWMTETRSCFALKSKHIKMEYLHVSVVHI